MTWAVCGAGVSRISVRSAAEGHGSAASDAQQPRSASFFVSCDATTGEYAALRHSAIIVMRMKCLERYALKVIFSPIANLSLETLGASMRRHCQKRCKKCLCL